MTSYQSLSIQTTKQLTAFAEFYMLRIINAKSKNEATDESEIVYGFSDNANKLQHIRNSIVRYAVSSSPFLQRLYQHQIGIYVTILTNANTWISNIIRTRIDTTAPKIINHLNNFLAKQAVNDKFA